MIELLELECDSYPEQVNIILRARSLSYSLLRDHILEGMVFGQAWSQSVSDTKGWSHLCDNVRFLINLMWPTKDSPVLYSMLLPMNFIASTVHWSVYLTYIALYSMVKWYTYEWYYHRLRSTGTYHISKLMKTGCVKPWVLLSTLFYFVSSLYHSKQSSCLMGHL